jgi:GcrA cell cycle regulator
MTWTATVLEDLRTLWGEGHSTSEIGRRLGVSKGAVIGKASRIGLDPRPSPIRSAKPPAPRMPRDAPKLDAYSAADVDAWVVAYEQGGTLRAISAATGAGRSTIRRWLLRRGVTLRDAVPQPMPFSPPTVRRRVVWPERKAPPAPPQWPAPGATTHRTCQWTEAHPKRHGIAFPCQCETHRGAYCETHYRVVYQHVPSIAARAGA